MNLLKKYFLFFAKFYGQPHDPYTRIVIGLAIIGGVGVTVFDLTAVKTVIWVSASALTLLMIVYMHKLVCKKVVKKYITLPCDSEPTANEIIDLKLIVLSDGKAVIVKEPFWSEKKEGREEYVVSYCVLQREWPRTEADKEISFFIYFKLKLRNFTYMLPVEVKVEIIGDFDAQDLYTMMQDLKMTRAFGYDSTDSIYINNVYSSLFQSYNKLHQEKIELLIKQFTEQIIDRSNFVKLVKESINFPKNYLNNLNQPKISVLDLKFESYPADLMIK